MNKSFKTTTLIAAIGMIVYTIYVVARYVIYQLGFMPPYHYDLWEDIRVRLIYDILPVSLIIACCGLWKFRPSNAASKSFRIFTLCLFVAMVGTLVLSPLYTHQIAGMAYLLPSIYWRVIMLVSGIVWLFMLLRQPLEEASPRSYRVTLIIAMAMLALPIVQEMISGMSLALGGEIFCFKSFVIKPWVRWIALIMLLTHFVFPQIKAINTTRNSHCLPGSLNERTFKYTRIATITLIVLSVLYFVQCMVLLRINRNFLFHYDDYNPIMHDFAMCFAYGVLFGGLISWIMLSIMAFCHLPNPRGYKIYNIVCQVLTLGSFVPAVVATDNIVEVFCAIFLLPFCAFFITTTIRVLSYSLPKQSEQPNEIDANE